MDPVSKLFSETQLRVLNQDTPTPLYFQLYSLLKNSILNGTIATGAQMPTEQQLAESFSVSRITAKRAMDELAAEDLVERRRGKGTHVTYVYKPQPVRAPLVGMLQEIESMARHSDAEVLECNMLQPPALVRDELNMTGTEAALYLVRVRSRDEQPFGYYTSWTLGVAKPDSKKEFKRTPRLEYFRQHGLEFTHITQTLSAVAATPELANHLITDLGAPLLSLVRRSFIMQDGVERMMDYLHAFYHPDRFQYQMDLKLDEAN